MSNAKRTYRLTETGLRRVEEAIGGRTLLQLIRKDSEGGSPVLPTEKSLRKWLGRTKNEEDRWTYQTNLFSLFGFLGLAPPVEGIDYEPRVPLVPATAARTAAVIISLHTPDCSSLETWPGAAVLEAFDKLVRGVFRSGGGSLVDLVWEFGSLEGALKACETLLLRLADFHATHKDKLRGCRLLPRLAVDVLSEGSADAQELASKCPPGRIALTTDAMKALVDASSRFRPLLDFGRPTAFVSRAPVALGGHEEGLEAGLSISQKAAVGNMGFPVWEAIKPDASICLANATDFFEEPLLIVVGATRRDAKDPLVGAATSDVVGLTECAFRLGGVIAVRVTVDEWEDSSDLAARSNMIILGSSKVNCFARQLSRFVNPIHFAEAEGAFAGFISDRGRLRFGLDSTDRDVGLVVACRNPYNPEKRVLWLAGITGLGSQATQCFLRDVLFEPSNDRVAEVSRLRPCACVVRALPTDRRHTPIRLTDYEVVQVFSQQPQGNAGADR